MKDAKASPQPVSQPEDSQASQPVVAPPKSAPLSPGMATLLRGTQPPSASQSEPKTKSLPEPKPTVTENPPRPAPRGRWLRASLVIADVLLLALATRLVLKAQGRLGFFEIT